MIDIFVVYTFVRTMIEKNIKHETVIKKIAGQFKRKQQELILSQNMKLFLNNIYTTRLTYT